MLDCHFFLRCLRKVVENNTLSVKMDPVTYAQKGPVFYYRLFHPDFPTHVSQAGSSFSQCLKLLLLGGRNEPGG